MQFLVKWNGEIVAFKSIHIIDLGVLWDQGDYDYSLDIPLVMS